MTTIVFFADENCSDRGDLGNVTGPPTGFCTEFGVSSFGSFRVETLERTCAVTIYDRDVDYCSSSTLSVANFGQCMTNATVSWLSTDCQDFNIATSEPPASFVPAPTRSTVPSTASAPASISASSTPTDSALLSGDEGLSGGAKAGIGIGIALAVLGIIGAVVFFLLRRRRRARAQAVPDANIKELHGSTTRPTEMSHWQDDKKAAATMDIKDQYHSAIHPVEAPGDAYWPGRMHEMDGDSVRTHEMSVGTATNQNTNSSTLRS